jgi:hypothetical protein
MTDLRLKTNISSGGGGSGGVDELSSESYLNGIEEELNRRVDLEIELMRSGMLQLVNLTQVSLVIQCLVVEPPVVIPNDYH